MSKVICDICGTTYPETADVCPVCGCAKNTTEQTAANLEQGDESAAYSYVKGGRFSKSNVRKRNNKNSRDSRRNDPDPENETTNKGLIVVVLILLLAIVAVLGYICVRYLFPTEQPVGPAGSSSSSSSSSGSSDNQDPVIVPCDQILLSAKNVLFEEEGQSLLLSVEITPADCTFAATFESSDVEVASVTSAGKIVAIGQGECVITVTCGDITATCNVVCDFGEPIPDDPEPDGPQLPEGFVLKFRNANWEKNGFAFTADFPNPVKVYSEIDGVTADMITWTSDDPEIATIDEGSVVKPIKRGTTTIRGTIGDQTISCTVYVMFDPEEVVEPTYEISHKDVTLYIKDGKYESFRLSLWDVDGANVEVVWEASEEGYVTIDGKTIKAVKATSDLQNKYVLVSVTVDDYTYSCKVRVVEVAPEETE